MAKIVSNILGLLLFSISFIFAQDLSASKNNQENPADIAFSKAAISVEAGEIYPFGDLVDAVENSYYAGLGFRYSYWDNVDGVVMFNYSYFKPVPKNVVVDGAHQFSGKLGLDWKWPLIRPVILGGGFTCNWARADFDGDDKSVAYKKKGGTLTDNETEFGWYGRINIPLWNMNEFRVGFNLLWEELWTLPERSDMLSAGVYVERSLW